MTTVAIGLCVSISAHAQDWDRSREQFIYCDASVPDGNGYKYFLSGVGPGYREHEFMYREDFRKWIKEGENQWPVSVNCYWDTDEYAALGRRNATWRAWGREGRNMMDSSNYTTEGRIKDDPYYDGKVRPYHN